MPAWICGQGRSQGGDQEAGDAQVCGLSASYCCYGQDNMPVAPGIPPGQWPPGPFPIPQQILDANVPARGSEGPSSGEVHIGRMRMRHVQAIFFGAMALALVQGPKQER